MMQELTAVEDALATLSNAIYDLTYDLEPRSGEASNMAWADAAVDRALADMAKIRRWLEGE